MRLLLPISLAAAVSSVVATGWLFFPGTGRGPAPSPLVSPEPGPVRVIAMSPGTTAAEPVRKPVAAAAPAPRSEAMAAIAAVPSTAPAADPAPDGDVLASVGRTLEGIRAAEAAPPAAGAASAGTGSLTPAQADAIRALAGRRKVRPVTRLSFPLEVGALVPAQVYLHPAPPEVSGLAPAGGGVGFAVVGDRYVVVGTQSRRIVAMGASR